MPPLVSIITPAYNAEPYLAEAIDGVVAQSFGTWELIIIDDGSTDATARIVKSYSDERIQYHYQNNQGVMSARNAGLRLARGEFVAFLDADDKWQPQFLAMTQAALAAQKNLAAVYAQARAIDEQGNLLPFIIGRPVASDRLYRQLCMGGFFTPSSALARTDIVRAVGAFDISLAGMGAEDWDLWLRIAKHYPIQALPTIQTYYRCHVGSLSTDLDGMQACRLSVVAKHFGPLTEPFSLMSEEARLTYGYAFVRYALDCLLQQQTETAWRSMTQAVTVLPALLAQLDVYYELACGDQPRGRRGTQIGLDLDRTGAAIIAWLDRLFSEADQYLQPYRPAAYGQAYLALGMLSDQNGKWGAARHWLRKAIASDPNLVRSGKILRRLFKVHMGRPTIRLLQAMIDR
jgi:tetratricopeptide (TPR) repeat protein